MRLRTATFALAVALTAGCGGHAPQGQQPVSRSAGSGAAHALTLPVDLPVPVDPAQAGRRAVLSMAGVSVTLPRSWTVVGSPCGTPKNYGYRATTSYFSYRCPAVPQRPLRQSSIGAYRWGSPFAGDLVKTLTRRNHTARGELLHSLVTCRNPRSCRETFGLPARGVLFDAVVHQPRARLVLHRIQRGLRITPA